MSFFKRAALYAFFILVLFVVPAKKTFAIDGFVKFTNPVGGEVYNDGDTVVIKWETSPNIDKVTIGYKTCPSCLSWVAYNIPNTGSYTWNINMRNNANTKFYLDIIAYETGKGSVEAFSGVFTINHPEVTGCTDYRATNYNPQATKSDGSCTYAAQEPVQTQPTCSTDTWSCGNWSTCNNGQQTRTCSKTYDCSTAQTPPPEVTQSCQTTVAQSNVVYGCTDRTATNYNASATHDNGSCTFASKQNTTQQPTVVNNVVNVQQTAILSITQIQLNNYYYFPGSKTTDLKKENPERVNNFSLDRANMMYFTFLGYSNLSSQTAVSTVKDIDKAVHMDYYYFWFEWRFWILFKKDVRVTFYDKAKLLNANSPVTVNGNTLKKDEYKLDVSTTGEKSVTIKPAVITKYVKEGEKVEIAMKPSLDINITPGQNIATANQKFMLAGTTTDPNTQVFVHFNGEKIELAVEKNGTFAKALTLQEGDNTLKVLGYKSPATEPFASVEGVVAYHPEPAFKLWMKIVAAALLASVIAAGVWLVTAKRK